MLLPRHPTALPPAPLPDALRGCVNSFCRPHSWPCSAPSRHLGGALLKPESHNLCWGESRSEPSPAPTPHGAGHRGHGTHRAHPGGAARGWRRGSRRSRRVARGDASSASRPSPAIAKVAQTMLSAGAVSRPSSRRPFSQQPLHLSPDGVFLPLQSNQFRVEQ